MPDIELSQLVKEKQLLANKIKILEAALKKNAPDVRRGHLQKRLKWHKTQLTELQKLIREAKKP